MVNKNLLSLTFICAINFEQEYKYFEWSVTSITCLI